jgi:hypothetical protein
MNTWTENLRDAEWFFLTAACLFSIGTIRSWSERRQKKWLLWFLIAPMAVLAYEVSFLFKVVALDLIRNWRDSVFVAWVVLTVYLWRRGNDYKEDAKRARELLQEEANQDSWIGKSDGTEHNP